MSGVEIRVRSNSTQARQDLSKLERSINNIDKTTSGVTRSFRNLALSITAAFGASAVLRSITTASDSFTNLGNRIALVTGRGDELQSTMTDLYSIAARARVPVNSSADVFNRFGLALQNTGVSSSDLLTVTEAVSKAVTISGSSAESAQAALIQLGQGLASGQLRGQELNSVLEQTPRLARAIADGIGIPFGQLRAAAEEGLLTTDAIFNAIIGQFDVIESEFNTLDATVESLIVTLRDELTRALSALDVELGFSNAVKNGIIVATNALRFFADNLESWVTLTQASFRIFQNNVILFSNDVKKVFSNLLNFDAPLSIENFNQAFNRIRSAYDENLGYLTEPIELKIREINLQEFIPSLDSVKSTLSSFISYVEGLFEYLYNAISGDSWWGEIFWEGPNRIGGPKFLEALDFVSNTLSSWSERISSIFQTTYENVSDKWNQLVNYLRFTTIETPSGDQEVLTRFGEILQIVNQLGGRILIDVSDRAVSFLATDRQIETPAGEQTVRTPFGQLLDLIQSGTNFIRIEFSDNFSYILDNLSFVFEQAKTLVSIRAGALGKSILSSLAGATEFAKSGTVAAGAFIETLIESKEAIAAAIVGAFVIASKIGFRRLALAVTTITFAPEILNSKSFQNAVRSLSQGFTEIFVSIFTGEGDFGAQLVEGIAGTLEAVGEGIINGIFGEENNIENDFAERLTGALVVGLGLVAIVGPLRQAVISLSKKIAIALWGSAFIAEVSAGIVASLSNSLLSSSVIGATAAWRPAARSLGRAIGTSIQAGILLGVTTGLAILLKNSLDSAVQDAGDATSRIITGESVQEQQERRARDIIQSSNSEFLFRLALENNSIDLELLSDQTISELAESVSGLNLNTDNWLDTISNYFGNMESNSDALATLTEELQRRNLNTSNPESGFASGGFVSGPGTKTSDSIPAMLSDGEYVIRADSVSKFGAGFFNSLNNGIIPRFATGGLVKDSFSLNENNLENYKSLKDWFEIDTTQVSNFFAAFFSKRLQPRASENEFEGYFNPVTPEIVFPSYLDPQQITTEQDLGKSVRAITIGYHELGHATDFINVYESNPVISFNELIEKFLKDYNESPLEEEIFANNFMMDKLSKYKFYNTGKDISKVGMISYIVGDIIRNLIESSFANDSFPNNTALSALRTAGINANSGKDNFIGAAVYSSGLETNPDIEVLTSRYNRLNDLLNLNFFSEFKEWLGVNRGSSNIARPNIENSESESNSQGLISSLLNSLKKVTSNDVKAYAVGGFVSGAGTSTSDSIPALLSNGEFVIKASSVKKFGPQFFDLLNRGLLPKFNNGGYVTQYDSRIAALSSQIDLLLVEGNIRAAERSEAILQDLLNLRRREIIRLYGDSAEDIENTIPGASTEGAGSNIEAGGGTNTTQQISGQLFAKQFANDFEYGLTQALSTGDFKSFGLMLLDSFTMGIISSFSQGLTDALFKGLIGEDGSEGPLASLFSGVNNWGSSLAQNVGTSITNGLETAIPQNASTAQGGGGLFSSIQNLFGSNGMFGNFFSSLFGLGGGGGLFSSLFGLSFGSFLGFNSGGIVPALNTTRTDIDSVPAMLTPGELVIPADKVKDFTNGNNNNQTIVNLSITGDISRQTRREVLRLIPEITSGVNQTNRERT